MPAGICDLTQVQQGPHARSQITASCPSPCCWGWRLLADVSRVTAPSTLGCWDPLGIPSSVFVFTTAATAAVPPPVTALAAFLLDGLAAPLALPSHVFISLLLASLLRCVPVSLPLGAAVVPIPPACFCILAFPPTPRRPRPPFTALNPSCLVMPVAPLSTISMHTAALLCVPTPVLLVLATLSMLVFVLCRALAWVLIRGPAAAAAPPLGPAAAART